MHMEGESQNNKNWAPIPLFRGKKSALQEYQNNLPETLVASIFMPEIQAAY